jgi:hypothetical protein
MAIKDIVTQRQRNIRAIDKLPGDKKSLSYTLGPGLHRVLESDSPFRTISEQTLETFLLVRRVDDQYIAYARHHKGGERIIDHGLVVYRRELLRDCPRDGVKPCAGAAGQHDSFPGRPDLIAMQPGFGLQI